MNKDIRGTIYTGFEEWLELNRRFKEDAAGIIADEEADSTHSENADRMQATLNTYRRNLLQSNAIAVFSAFAAGAVGPDLWTVIISPTLELLTEQTVRASWFFDMGHYNLSHLFPKYTLKKIREIEVVTADDNLQKTYQTAYILGYISHIALDILGHLNVNVFAGAYHSQQPDRWETEQSGILENVNVFNNHNKVEHYLDAYIRFFCFEGCYDETNYQYKDIVKTHFGQEKDGKYDEWNFPNFNDYYRNRLSFGLVIKTDGITDEDRDFLDLSTCLPGVFVHRYYLTKGETCDYGVAGDLRVKPFIKQYFWDAYTNKDDWMERKQDGLIDSWLCSGRQSLSDLNTELDKLAFFNIVDDQGWRDPDDQFTTQYYYLHTVIPNMERLVEYTDQFFSPADFGDFIRGTLQIGEEFIDQAMQYLSDGDRSHLDCLDHWNLDTGIAYRIKKGTDTADYEVPVSLDLISVLDLEGLEGWTIPETTDTPVEATRSWEVPVAEDDPEAELQHGETLFSTHKQYNLAMARSIGIEIQVRQTCFYADDY
ncbi:MAG: zinc dependent phospholipase C family protein, partial [Spirochaetales bacterium]|nr:zinc dependent phospholipase C family protein [Spirochaetales bacterium]